jgi:hypothetical protein
MLTVGMIRFDSIDLISQFIDLGFSLFDFFVLLLELFEQVLLTDRIVKMALGILEFSNLRFKALNLLSQRIVLFPNFTEDYYYLIPLLSQLLILLRCIGGDLL